MNDFLYESIKLKDNNVFKEFISSEIKHKNTSFKRERVLYLIQSINLETEISQNKPLLEVSQWFYKLYNMPYPNWLATLCQNYYVENGLSFWSYSDFYSNMWKTEDIIKDAISLSDDNISNYHPSESSIENWSRLREKNSQFYIAALLLGDIVGQIGAIAISEKEYHQLIDGNLDEEKIEGVKNTRYLYIPSFAVNKKYRTIKTVLKLLHLFLEQIVPYKDNIWQLTTIAYTSQGINAAKKLGFKFLKKHASEGYIYKATPKDILHSKVVKKISRK